MNSHQSLAEASRRRVNIARTSLPICCISLNRRQNNNNNNYNQTDKQKALTSHSPSSQHNIATSEVTWSPAASPNAETESPGSHFHKQVTLILIRPSATRKAAVHAGSPTGKSILAGFGFFLNFSFISWHIFSLEGRGRRWASFLVSLPR